MTKAPAFQFYAAEYLADMNVQLLTLEQEGAYIRLLAICWREGRIPNDDLRLSALCKRCKVAILAAVKDLFEVSEDGLHLFHKRLEKERQKQEVFRERQSRNGARGGRPVKPEETQAFTKTPRVANPQESSSSSSSSSSAKKEQKTSLRQAQSDPRHVPFKLACETYAKFKGVTFVWDGGEAKILASLLAASPELTLSTFQQCLNHRARSVVTHGDRPREWLGTILKYQEGPLDQYGKPQGASNGNQSKGDATYEALKRSIQAGRNQNDAGEIGDTPAGEDGGAGVRGLLGRPDAIRDKRYPGSPGVTVLTPPR